MLERDDERNDARHELLDPAAQVPAEIPAGFDRRRFIMRSAVISAAAVLTGCTRSETESKAPAPTPATSTTAAAPAASTPPLDPNLNVVKKGQGPVMTVVDEFYKVGPGPSSSHTIGPMRITYDFYQRCTKLPADQLAKATGLKVHLFGSLSATGKGHGTERAALAGLLGKEPATVDPLFLDKMRDEPDQSFPLKLGDKTFNLTLKDIVYDATKGDFHHPNTMTCKLLAGDTVLFEQEYYSVGGGFIEWKGYTPPKKNAPKYPFRTMEELRKHADSNKLTIAQVMLANEMSISGKSQEEVYAFIDKITGAMVAIVKSGLNAPEGVLPGPIKLKTKAGTVYKRAQDEAYQAGPQYRPPVCGRSGGVGGKRARPSRGHRPDRGFRRRHAGARLRPGRRRPQAIAGQDPRRDAGGGGNRLPLQTPRDVVGGRRRLPGGDRGRLGDGCGAGRDSPRRPFPRGRERRRIGARTSPGDDVRPGRRVRADPVHRALRLRGRQGLDGLRDCEQRSRVQSSRQPRPDHHGPGRDGQGHEQQVQGDERGRTGIVGDALLMEREVDT